MFKKNINLFSASVCIASLVVVSGVYGQETDLYPVENGKIILQENCEKGSQPTWNQEISGVTGLKQGEKVLVITKDQLIPVTLGDLECFAEGCGGNYVSIHLLSPTNSNIEMLGAIKIAEAKGLKGVPIQVESSQSECSEIFSQITDPYFKEIKENEKCERVSISGKPFLFLATKQFMQENGYGIYLSKAKTIIHGQNRKNTSEITDVDRDTDPLKPIFALIDKNNHSRLVWRKASGLCCPREVTVRLSDVDDSGKISFGPAFTAGGQPCD